MAIILALGAIAVTFTQIQRQGFAVAAERSVVEAEVMVALDRLIVVMADPISVAIYAFDTPEAVRIGRREYRETNARIYAAFDRAADIMSSQKGASLLRAARDHWDAVTRGADSAIALLPADLAGALALGKDPFAETVWAPFNLTQTAMSDVRAESMHEMKQRMDELWGAQRLTMPLVLLSALAALLLCWGATRRINRRVLIPLESVRRASVAIDEHGYRAAVDGAVSEIQDLALALEQRATSVRLSHDQLRDQAHSDALTGIPNRQAFTERLEAQVAQSNHGAAGVLFIDLDDFKVVNDSLGHAAGDEVLKVVAQRLLSATRGCELVARLGGDEFAVLLEGTIDASTAIVVAERILVALSEPAMIEHTSVAISCSIGIAVSDADLGTKSADEIVRDADFAMYTAKGQGKNRFQLYAPEMHTAMLSQAALKKDLSLAVELQQFELFYQPIVHIDSEQLLGFEALIRWRHPVRGLLMPAEFIELAERTGDIVPMGAWVIDQACRDLAILHLAHVNARAPWVSVNVSGRQLGHGTLAGTVRDSLARHRIAPGSLIIEVTEAVAMENAGSASDELAELRQLGVHVALDDFGTGFSSLRSLDELPIDIIKIDRSFVTQRGEANGAMLEAIVTLARTLGLDMIAEGIEEPGELARLRTLGVECGQGYLFARPMPAIGAARFRSSPSHTRPATDRAHKGSRTASTEQPGSVSPRQDIIALVT